MRATLTCLCAALLLGLAAACGGDGGDGDAEFVAQVNSVCADYRPKLALLTPPADTIEEWAAIGADLGDLLEASVNELRLLEPPDDLGDDYAAWLEQRTRTLTAVRDLQNAGANHDQAGVDAAIAEADAAIAEADELADEIGFDACSPTGVRTSSGR